LLFFGSISILTPPFLEKPSHPRAFGSKYEGCLKRANPLPERIGEPKCEGAGVEKENTEILGGRSVKVAMWLQGRTDFNSDLFWAKPGRSPWRTGVPARQIAENGLEIGQTPGKRAGPRRVFILITVPRYSV